MYIKEFLKNLIIGIRKRELIYWSLPICSIIFGTISEELSQYLIVIISSLFFIMLGQITYDVIRFLKNIFPRKKAYPIKIPDLQVMVSKMGLELSSQPFWEKDSKIPAMALGNFKKTKRIIFGKDFLTSLSSKEKVFVAGHEFCHLYGHEFRYYPIIFVPILGALFLLQIILQIPQYIMFPGFCGATVACICVGKRSFEFIADINGAINVNKENAINALKKAYIGKETKSFNLHPSLNSRIKNLEKYYQKSR